MFLPEWSTICQYRPEISTIIVKKQWRERLLLAHPVLYILKTQNMCCTFWNNHFKINQKALKTTYGNMHNLQKWVRQCNLSCLNVTPPPIFPASRGYIAKYIYRKLFKSFPQRFIVIILLRSESPSGMRAKLHTLAASNNRDHIPRSLSP